MVQIYRTAFAIVLNTLLRIAIAYGGLSMYLRFSLEPYCLHSSMRMHNILMLLPCCVCESLVGADTLRTVALPPILANGFAWSHVLVIGRRMEGGRMSSIGSWQS